MVAYTNRPICKTCQLLELKKRGLIVNDDNLALSYLDSISYFRLACYMKSFETDSVTHKYFAGTSFDNIIELYQFDKELRSLIFMAIQNVEIAFKRGLCQRFLRQIRQPCFATCMENYGGSIVWGIVKNL